MCEVIVHNSKSSKNQRLPTFRNNMTAKIQTRSAIYGEVITVNFKYTEKILLQIDQDLRKNIAYRDINDNGAQ